jgi:hypothetical protein
MKRNDQVAMSPSMGTKKGFSGFTALGLNDTVNLDEGSMRLADFVLKKLIAAAGSKSEALVKKAVS